MSSRPDVICTAVSMLRCFLWLASCVSLLPREKADLTGQQRALALSGTSCRARKSEREQQGGHELNERWKSKVKENVWCVGERERKNESGANGRRE
ncbi:Uncharacterized protein DAT39_017932 [Clarias magur]|uniref:Secreted protein n=1 Tax=Clarias magur TaxID=1594786 RepID=A0A8J4U5A5_CLAMG|nr:Uncharacterized protein DAT39_017932 [Clarias magur]